MAKDWTPAEEALRLEQRFAGVNQADFARKHGVPGGPSMISQHIKGRRPINMEAAVAYAKGFGVPLSEVSPRLAALAKSSAEVMRAPGPNEPRPPPPDYSDRHQVDDSDWATLQAVKTMMSEKELAEIRERHARVAAQVKVQLEREAAKAKAKGKV